MRAKWRRVALFVAGLAILSPLAAPRLLAFPYSTRVGRHRVYAEAQIDHHIMKVVEEADRRLRTSPIGTSRPADQDIFLTSGQWRWTWLSLPNRAAFAVSRPFAETIVVNLSDTRADVVRNGASIAGARSLSGTLAHEMTHGAIRAHFGVSADWRSPAELREGYCDHVAGGGSLKDEKARALASSGKTVPAVLYWRGRKKVEAALAVNGGNVDGLFENWR